MFVTLNALNYTETINTNQVVSVSMDIQSLSLNLALTTGKDMKLKYASNDEMRKDYGKITGSSNNIS